MGKGNRIRLGLFGVGASLAHSARGYGLARKLESISGLQLVAVCDCVKEKVEAAGSEFNVPGYTDFDRFLEHEMDAVLLANFFHEHASYAVKALDAGKHVLS